MQDDAPSGGEVKGPAVTWYGEMVYVWFSIIVPLIVWIAEVHVHNTGVVYSLPAVVEAGRAWTQLDVVHVHHPPRRSR